MLKVFRNALRYECGGPRAYIWTTLVIAWVGIWLATPFSMDRLPEMFTAGVIAQALAVAVGLTCSWQAGRVIAVFALVSAITILMEGVGTNVGIPFGDYRYTDALQPQFARVPVIILAAWFMMLGPAWGVAETLLPDRITESIGGHALFAAVAAGAITVWDLYLDPQMTMFGMWWWRQEGLYFGIPLQNFFGWWLTGFIATFLIRPDGVPRVRMLVMYTITWLMQAVGLGIMWGQPWPALAGFIGMGVFAVPAWRAEWKAWTQNAATTKPEPENHPVAETVKDHEP